ncbi:MAG: hypothetical protein K2Y37_06775 [Pirellulales bacterium]|nr:hypothetical protein [Pirellulales bacterium]
MTNNESPLRESATNQAKLRQVEAALARLLDDALRRGFYGTLALEVAVQDGVIQNLRHKTERIER